jgi:hypothetical protein
MTQLTDPASAVKPIPLPKKLARLSGSAARARQHRDHQLDVALRSARLGDDQDGGQR